MTWANPNFPNLPDFILFGQDSMGIDPLYLPVNSPFYSYAFNRAMGLVNNVIGGGIDYTLAVYNCAGHILLQITPDQTGRDFFMNARKEYALMKPAVGVVASSSDNGTSESLAVPDSIRQLTLGDLQFMKTYWGRSYLEYNQDFGDICGLS